jgi:hypothetical protein
MEHQFLQLIISATGVAAKMWLTPNKHSMYIRFLWFRFIQGNLTEGDGSVQYSWPPSQDILFCK